MIQRVVEVNVENVDHACLVTNMFDINGKATDDLSKAESAVVKITETAWINIDPSETPIHTVH